MNQCDNCHHWKRIDTNDITERDQAILNVADDEPCPLGHCCRFPPTPCRVTNLYSYWDRLNHSLFPVTDESDSCGEWKALTPEILKNGDNP